MPYSWDSIFGSSESPSEQEKPGNGKHPKKHVKTKKADQHRIVKPTKPPDKGKQK